VSLVRAIKTVEGDCSATFFR